MAWRLEGDIGAMNLDIVCSSGRIAMMDCENEDMPDEDIAANARIMAAAPEMYTALEGLVYNYAASGRVPDGFVRDVARLLLEIGDERLG